MTKFMKTKGLLPDVIYCSPILRAKQTAGIIQNDLSVDLNEDALGNTFNSKKLLSLIPPCFKNQIIFFVGHSPTLDYFVKELTEDPNLPTSLCKSCAVHLEFHFDIKNGSAQFIAYYTTK